LTCKTALSMQNILTPLIFFLLHPLAKGTQQSAPFQPHLLRLFPAAGQPSRTMPGRATGRSCQPSGPHAEGRCLRVWVGIGHGVRNDPITPPHRAHPRRGSSGGHKRHQPSPANGQGHWGQITSACPRPRFKRVPGRRIADARPPTQLGFSSLLHLCLRWERRGRGRRRAAPEERRTRASRGQGAGREEPELRRTTAGVDIYPACTHPFTEPATTTSPPHREHRTATLFSSPLGLFPVMDRRRRDASPFLKLAWMLAFEPQNCRTATD
jgi:hypothetical protein